MRDWLNDLALARYLNRKAKARTVMFCRRTFDNTLWAASSPQNMGLAMVGVFSGKAHFHFAKVRVWRGVPIVSRKVFWNFTQSKGERLFRIEREQLAYWLVPFSEEVESAKIKELDQ